MINIDQDVRYGVANLAGELAKAKREEVKLLEDITSGAAYAAPSKLESDALKYASLSERNFLEGKKLSSLATGGSDASTYDYKAMGFTENFPCALSCEDGIWDFYLPPAPSAKIGKRGNDIGRFMGYLVKNLIESYESVYGKTGYLYEPVVVFEFGFRESDPMSKLFDADNRDTKRILDAMTGKLFPDDNILTVRTLHYGIKSEEEHTRVFVMEKGSFPCFLEQNSQW